jgi:hypothetical protein
MCLKDAIRSLLCFVALGRGLLMQHPVVLPGSIASMHFAKGRDCWHPKPCREGFSVIDLTDTLHCVVGSIADWIKGLLYFGFFMMVFTTLCVALVLAFTCEGVQPPPARLF